MLCAESGCACSFKGDEGAAKRSERESTDMEEDEEEAPAGGGIGIYEEGGMVEELDEGSDDITEREGDRGAAL